MPNENVMASAATTIPGMGNAVPPQQGSLGSGDNWSSDSSLGPYSQDTNEDFYPHLQIEKLNEQLSEESINPTDKIGTMMAKKMKVPVYFKKGKGQSIKQKKIGKK